MAIDKLIRNPAYFTNLVNSGNSINKGHTIDAIDFDKRFKIHVDHINSVLVNKINDLTQGVLNGIDDPSSANMLLRNVGDGTTRWSFINAEQDFLNSEISLSKLKNAPAGTILTTYQDGEFVANKTPSGDQLVFKTQLNVSGELEAAWGLLTGDNFTNESIDGSKLEDGTITLDNLREGTLIVYVPDNSIDTRHFADASVTSIKITPGTFHESHFAPDPDLPRTQALIESIRANNIQQGLSSSKLAPLSIGFNTSNFESGVQILTEKLADESITDEHLMNYTFGLPSNQPGTINGKMASGLRLQSEHLKYGSVDRVTIFDNEVRINLQLFGIS